MRAAQLFCLTVLLLGSFTRSALAAENRTFSFPLARAPHPLALDPSLADPAWQAGKVPQDGPWMNVTRRAPATLETTAYALYDDAYIYIAFIVAQDVPTVATQTTDNVGFGTDDFVGLGLDTSGAGSQVYFFETTPRGTRYQSASENARYRPDWRSATAIVPGGWHAVMKIPLNTMRIRSSGKQTWRIEFIRNVAASAEHYSWAWNGLMQDQSGANWPQFTDVRFWPGTTVEGVKANVVRPKPRLEVYGLESVGGDRDEFVQPDGTVLAQNVRHDGLDVSYPLSSTINFVGTLNPDFSNVEIDQQTIAPQEFTRQLQEYRPFFAQGAQYVTPADNTYSNYLGPQNEIFYTPSIGAFDRGEKLEGTFGKQSFGVLNFRGYNDETGETFDDTAFGYKHALVDSSFSYWGQGVLANHSIDGTDRTFELGAKARNLKSGLVALADGEIESGSWNGGNPAHSAFAFVDEHRPNYEINLGYANISPFYNPLDGYTSDSDIHGPQLFTDIVGSMKGVKNFTLFTGGDRFFDRSGAVHEADFGSFLNAVFSNGFSLDGLGPTISTLRGYDQPSQPDCSGPSLGTTFFGGAPCYRNGHNVAFNLMGIPVGYDDGTPHPVDASVNYGTFDGNFIHYYTTSTSRPIGTRFTIGLEYDSTFERPLIGGPLDSQFLRRVSIGINTGPESNATILLRSINGLGGFATQPGNNLAAAFHQHFSGGDLYINYGTPAAPYTLSRLIVKYVFRAGAADGT